MRDIIRTDTTGDTELSQQRYGEPGQCHVLFVEIYLLHHDTGGRRSI